MYDPLPGPASADAPASPMSKPGSTDSGSEMKSALLNCPFAGVGTVSLVEPRR